MKLRNSSQRVFVKMLPNVRTEHFSWGKVFTRSVDVFVTQKAIFLGDMLGLKALWILCICTTINDAKTVGNPEY